MFRALWLTLTAITTKCLLQSRRMTRSPQAVGELFLSYLNVEDLLESSSTEAKVVIVNPGGRVETFSSFHDKTKSIMLNLCRKKWKTVANLLPPQSPRGFSALARLYYLATKTAMLRRLPFV